MTSRAAVQISGLRNRAQGGQPGVCDEISGNQQYARDNTRDFIAMMNDFFKQIDKYMSKINHVEEPAEKEVRDGMKQEQAQGAQGILESRGTADLWRTLYVILTGTPTEI